jgi:arabinose-5-phosphate isomerase
MAVSDSQDKSSRPNGSSIESAKRLLRIECEALSTLESRIDERFIEAVHILASIRGRVIVSGLGKSGHIGRKISATFASTGTPSTFLHPTEAAHGDLGMVTRDDAALLISKNGASEELIGLIPYFKFLDIPIVGLVGNLQSELAEKCDVCLDVSVKEEGCPMNLAPTASTTAALAMGDALAVALLEEKGFQPEDFAFLHPGGALGRRLSMRVRDIMHTGDEMPVVPPDARLRDVVVEMTQKLLGAACIVDSEKRIIGIFTDGDLRRAFEQGINFETSKISDVTKRFPKTISPDALVTRAINIMETFNILVLPVAGPDRILLGIVHMHDLLKSGIGK